MTQYQGVDLTAEAGETATPFSWHTPHPIFVIILVGQEEIPFGIQKDLLCTQSPYFRDLFNQAQWADKIEHIVKLPNYDNNIFGCFQNFIFTGKVYDGKVLPSYQILLGVWKLAVDLRMAPLRIAVMDTMSERRNLTSTIPSTALLIQAWQETAEGSGLRLMLINWAAEHMRASPEIRNTFAKSLPKEILSELVIIMAGFPVPVAPPQAIQQVSRPSTKPNTAKRENPADDVPQYQGSNKRSRISAVATANEDCDLEFKSKPTSTPTTTKKAPRKSQGGRRNIRTELNEEPNPDREMAFCSDLITRMLSAPGFWTRLVAPFRNPVDPITDNVPNYFSVIKKPICLRDIKIKMDAGQYSTAQEFEADMRQIFSNCYEYWTQEDAIFKSCEQLERSFNDKFAARDKWRGATIKAEIIED